MPLREQVAAALGTIKRKIKSQYALLALVLFSLTLTVYSLWTTTSYIINPSNTTILKSLITSKIAQYIININKNTYYLFIITTVLTIVYPLLARRSDIFSTLKIKLKETFLENEDKTEVSKNHSASPYTYLTMFLTLLLPLLLAVLIVYLRFRNGPQILGFDTPYYVYIGELTLYKGFLYTLLSIKKPITTIISFTLYALTHNIEVVGALYPVIIGGLYTTVNMYIAYKVSNKNKTATLFTGVFTPLSYHYIRLTYDLFRQTIANVIVIVVFYLLSRLYYEGENKNKWKTFITIAILLGVLLLSHIWTATLLVIFLALYLLSRTKRKQLKILVPLVSVFVTIGAAYMYFFNRRFLNLLIYILFNETNFFSLNTDNWIWFPASETLLLWAFASIGIITITLKNREFGLITGSWTLFTFTLIMITGYSQSYRLILLQLVPIQVGFGVYGLWNMINRISMKIRNFKLDKRIIGISFILLIFALSFESSVSKAHIGEYNFRPAPEAIDQMKLIRELIGFENKSTIVLIDLKKIRASYYWPIMIIGSNVYFGSILDLVSGVKDIAGNYYSDWFNKTLITGDKLYFMTQFERSISEEIANGVYEITNKNMSEWEDIILSSSIWTDNFTEQLFDAQISDTRTVSYFINNNMLCIKFNAVSGGEMRLKYNLTMINNATINASKFFLKIAFTNITITMKLKVISNDSLIIRSQTISPSNNTWLSFTIGGKINIEYFELIFIQPNSPISQKGVITLKYLVFI